MRRWLTETNRSIQPRKRYSMVTYVEVAADTTGLAAQSPRKHQLFIHSYIHDHGASPEQHLASLFIRQKKANRAQFLGSMTSSPSLAQRSSEHALHHDIPFYFHRFPSLSHSQSPRPRGEITRKNITSYHITIIQFYNETLEFQRN